MIKYSYIMCLFLISGCDLNNTSRKSDFFAKSYKKQISSGDINKNEVQYFDKINRVYSNFKYGISYKEERGWDIDYGVGQYTIYRAIQNDSTCTFSINVIELDQHLGKEFNLHDVIDQLGEESYKAKLASNHLKLANTQILNSSVKKVYFRNYPALKTTLKTNSREEDYEIGFTDITYQLYRNNATITCNLSVPSFFYHENKESFDRIFHSINLLNIN